MAEVREHQPVVEGLDTGFVRLILIVVLFTMAVMLFMFSLALMKDLQTLQRAPELVWAFICGAPGEDGVALPLLLTLSTLALLGAIGLSGWQLWQHLRHISDN